MPAQIASPLIPLFSARELLTAAGNWLRGFVLSVRASDAGSASDASARGADAAASAEFHRLVLPHLDAAYSLARYLTRDTVASEDIVQDAFLKAFRSFSGFRGGDSRAWILAIVRNTARDWQSRQRFEQRRTVTPAGPSEDDTDPSPDAIEAIACDIESAETGLVRDGENARVRAVVERLPAPLREILVLREMEDLSYRDIADLTQIPIGTVMSRLARARSAFATIWQRLEKAGGAS